MQHDKFPKYEKSKTVQQYNHFPQLHKTTYGSLPFDENVGFNSLSTMQNDITAV